ncbi:hypothetical protein EIL50_01245 [bacterium NHP-B]|nr:hypothetical protein EIL50_01245 [bacterium NHP-B]
MATYYDLIISGSGPVGCLLAYLVAHENVRVGIIENKKPQKNLKNGRSFAISYAHGQALDAVKLWQGVATTKTDIKDIVVSKEGTRKGLIYRAQDMGVSALGFLVNEHALRTTLFHAITQHPRIDWLCPHEVVHHTQHPSYLELHLDTKETLRTSLWIGAEGKNSPMRQHISPHTCSWSYDQKALVFTVHHTQDHNGRAFEHFTSKGPLAFLPLHNQSSAVIWSLEAPMADALTTSPTTLLHALLHHFGWGLGDMTLASPVAAYPLDLIMPLHHAQGRQLLVGDAAHSIHPVAGQGLNLGIRDAFILADHLKNRYQLGLDLGMGLEDYLKRRRADYRSMAGATHGLVLGLQQKWTSPLWAFGTTFVDMCAPLKEAITRHAMGLGIDPTIDNLSHGEPDHAHI